MKKLKLKEQQYEYTWENDIDRIVNVFADRGYEISHSDAACAWEKFSDTMCTGWMVLGTDEEIFQDCFCYFEEIK